MRYCTRSWTNKLKNAKRPWSDLPHDLLEPIADHLALVDLHGFRGVCKEWRYASSKASSKCRSLHEKNLWLLLYNDNSNCKLFDPMSGKIYTTNIPELDGATCIASFGGWLLFCGENSLFFFCPFSRAKIILPQLPNHPQLFGHVGVFTSAPTSPDCIVSITSYSDKAMMELNLLRRGENEWVTHVSRKFRTTANIKYALFDEGTFYYLTSAADKALSFAVQDERWLVHKIVEVSPPNQSIISLPFINYRWDHFKNMTKIKKKLGFKEGLSISTCGAIRLGNEDNECVYVEDLNAKGDNEIPQMKGVYVQPRFFQIQQNQSWSL
ncbi:hypothetical protein GIB67_034467 [Kingdonia uniflora]|uniref:F-box domain-containing protein n=1 Tax=Kingdonia uniflora TaxID=39325 RepID=A0A7J7PAX4_9MAGN|nr:hypothetical protein GIB67_034467 [Kingdonia uniflora]